MAAVCGSTKVGKKKVAAIVTEYRPGSHADVLLTKYLLYALNKYLKGFPLDDGFHPPRVELAALYFDQVPPNDIGHALAEEHGVPVFGTITQALTLGTSTRSNDRAEGSLAVDGVLIIGEHGDYAFNEADQHLYPRKYFMEQVTGVMATSGRAVPIFNDKHLSYNWHDALWMVERARELGAPFMAGSSLVFAWREPWVEHALDADLQEAVSIGYSGLDIYGFHALEALQCMVERRAGGETGLAAVQCLEGDAVWDAAQRGFFSLDLAEAACACIEDKPPGGMVDNTPEPAAFLLEYRDGFRATVLMLSGYVQEQAYAARVRGPESGPESLPLDDEVVACCMRLPQGAPYGQPPYRPAEMAASHFAYLGRSFEECVLTGQAQYPVERCLLTSGALEANGKRGDPTQALRSRAAGNRRMLTPHLEVKYRSYETLKIRPTAPRPTGASLMQWPPPKL